ncbi:hypothetical protein AXE65_00185 [Ventosimonas gracilis]|uniref:Penicillin-binding protein activator n=1 Tax=Ventosimonas gracilis TaxID=1680762 RepID=A0A139SVL2_9GAMM|nr:penicillin-binding protein activator [Ventosimonas gracilis]KXU38618.1 hypothetical protein AXE65_00185 [Ventosimonas gracilis]
MMTRLYPFVILFLLALLVACRNTPTAQQEGTQAVEPPSVEQLLKKAGRGQSEKAQKLRLSAAELAFAQGDIESSSTILAQITQASLPLAEQMQISALTAEIALAQGQNKAAMAALEQPAPAHLDELPLSQQIRYQQVRARVLEANGQALAALRVRLYIAPLLEEEAQQASNDEAIWTLTKDLAPSIHETLGDSVLDGWLTLARSVSEAGALLYQQQDAIRTFVQNNPGHPAAQKLPPELLQLLTQQDQYLSRVALLLPQQGSLAAVGQALRDGFIAAQWQALKAQGRAPLVDVYDSERISDMDAFYQQAKASGALMVIGPLEKPLVRQLAMREQLPLPTLALNYADVQHSGPADLFQFGLAAEDEAREVARRAAADGMRRAVVMVPKSEWGERVLDVFHQSWSALGGELVAVEYLDQPVQISDQVANLLRQLRATSDGFASADFMFLAATSQQAQQVKPTLAYHRAANLPVYATSHLYNGSLMAGQGRDLEGIFFCETPWLLDASNPLRQQVASNWPEANSSLGRLYAMGIDAYHLASRLSLLKDVAGSSYEGLSGQLSLDNNLRIVRRLPWATFRNGQVQRLSPIGEAP